MTELNENTEKNLTLNLNQNSAESNKKTQEIDNLKNNESNEAEKNKISKQNLTDEQTKLHTELKLNEQSDLPQNKSTSSFILTEKNLDNEQNFASEKEPFFEKNALKGDNNDSFLQNENWFKADKESFLSTFTNFDENSLKELLLNDDFVDFALNDVGKKPLKDIYNSYLKFNEKIDRLATKKANIMYAKKMASPGSMHSSVLTQMDSWNTMSDDDFERAIQNAKKGYYSKN